MKRILSILMILALLLALAGCAASGDESATAAPASSPAEAEAAESTAQTDDSDENDILVVYFSRTGEQYGVGVIEEGNTAIVADMIADATGADLFEITPATDNYPTTYSELTDYAKEEQNNNERPEIASTVEDFDRYDTVFLGYPIWWGDLPMICYTFLESYDFTDKTVIPFCTHEGSGDAGTQAKIASAIPAASVGEILAIRGSDAQNERDATRQSVTDWLAGMDI